MVRHENLIEKSRMGSSISSTENIHATQSNSPDSDQFKQISQKHLLQKQRLMPRHALKAFSMKLSELAVDDDEEASLQRKASGCI